MAGLDLRLFIEALKVRCSVTVARTPPLHVFTPIHMHLACIFSQVRRQCLADLDETMDAMAAAAAMSQFD